jgi:hypothetical protein
MLFMKSNEEKMDHATAPSQMEQQMVRQIGQLIGQQVNDI